MWYFLGAGKLNENLAASCRVLVILRLACFTAQLHFDSALRTLSKPLAQGAWNITVNIYIDH